MTTIADAENTYRSKLDQYEGVAARIAGLVNELLESRSMPIAPAHKAEDSEKIKGF